MKQNTMKKIILLSLALVYYVDAQTAPVTPQPVPTIEHVSGNNYSFTWEGLPNRVYFMQVSSQASSENGFSWEYVPDIRMGAGQTLSMGFEANSENSEFFRLVYIDYFGQGDPNILDFDGDGYTNLEEANENTSSFDTLDFPGGSLGYDEDGSGGSGQGGGQSTQDWEYKITYKVDSVGTDYLIDEDNPVPSFPYSLGEEVVTQLIFTDIEEENEAVFVRVEPNPDHDPSNQSSNPHKVVEIIRLNSQEPTWQFTGKVGTEPQGKLFPLEVVVPKLDAQGLEVSNQLVIAKELKVAKMEGGELIDFGAQPESYEYLINDDRDRFYVRARNLPSDIGEVSIFFQTGHATLKDYRDKKTEIELEPNQGQTIFSTKSQVLVSDDPDDDYFQDSENDDLDMFIDEFKSERSHITALRGVTRVASFKHNGKEHPVNLDIIVKPRKTVTVKVYRIKKQNLAMPMVGLGIVKDHIKALKERYAQIGLDVIVDGPHDKNIPNTINLDDGYQIQDAGKAGTVQEENDFIAAVASAATNDIEIFYVPKITDFSDPNLQTAGYAYVPDKFALQAFHNNIVISGTANKFVLAHELGHILLDDGGHDYPTFNLMSETVNVMTVSPLQNDKRLRLSEENDMYQNALVKDL